MSRGPAATFLLLLAVFSFSCDEAPRPGEMHLAIVAVDGATWNVMSPLLEAGRVPHLAALYREGAAGAFKSVEPLSPAPVWTSVATGKSVPAHGIATEVVKIPGRYAQRPVTADARRFPALWTIVGAQGLTVGVTGWPVTFPAEQVNGFMITDAYGDAGQKHRGTIRPEGALAEDPVAKEPPQIPDSVSGIAALDDGLAGVFRDDLADLTRGLSLVRVYQPRVALFRFRSIDYASHRFWQYHDRSLLRVQTSRGREISPERVEELSAAIPGTYEFFDAWIGMLLEGLPEGTTLMIVSGFGLRSAQVADTIHVDMNRLLERVGLFHPGVDGRPDWSRTTAFNLSDARSSRRGIWLNLTERESEGTVASADAGETARRVISLLEPLKTAGGDPLFRSVTYQERRGEDEPDIRVIENPGLDPMGMIRIGSETVEARSLFRRFEESLGAHDETGLFLAAGPGITPGRTGWSASVYDLLPTVLYLLGLPLSPDLPGNPVEEILVEPVREDYPQVDSYNDLPAAPTPLIQPPEIVRRQIEMLEAGGHL